MIMINRLFTCLVLCLVLLPSVAFADKKAPPPDDRPLITALDINKRTIELTRTAKGIKTSYILAPEVTIEINGKSSTIKNLKVGMHVHLCRVGSGMDEPQVIEDLDISK
jgi:hypothetical protein